MRELTAADCKVLVSKGRKMRQAAGGVKGLYLCVTGKDTAHWSLRWKRQDPLTGRHVPREMGLGSFAENPRPGKPPDPDARTLQQARDAAFDLRRAIRDGRDPLAERKAAKERARATALAAATAAASARTFKDVTEEAILLWSPGWKGTKSKKEWEGTFATHAYPLIGTKPVEAVSADDVLGVMNANIAPEGEPPLSFWLGKEVAARRLRQRIEKVLDYAMARGYRPKGDNPAKLKGGLAHALPKQRRKVRHLAAMPWKDAPAFMAKLRACEQTIPVLALQFAVLTATRTDEVRKARWCEVDPASNVWTLPEERMKAGNEHIVPLPAAAMAVLEAMRPHRRADDYIFPGTKNGKPFNEGAMRKLLRDMGISSDTASVHGFRSMLRDWGKDTRAEEREILEDAVAHVIKSEAEAAYSRTAAVERRRMLMEKWAEYLSGERGTVTPMLAAAA